MTPKNDQIGAELHKLWQDERYTRGLRLTFWRTYVHFCRLHGWVPVEWRRRTDCGYYAPDRWRVEPNYPRCNLGLEWQGGCMRVNGGWRRSRRRPYGRSRADEFGD